MMSSTVHPPLFKHIEFDVNIERRKARIVIPDVLESTARPIRSPATGAEHRVRINLPNGIEFDLAEIGSGTTKTMASIALDLKTPTFISLFCASRAKGWSAHDRIQPCPHPGILHSTSDVISNSGFSSIYLTAVHHRLNK
jgi:hypothetical protein